VIRAEMPDIILLDLDLGGEQALEHIDEIVEASPQSRIIVLTGLADAHAGRRAMAAGARGFVHKNEVADHLLSAIRKVHNGEAWFDRSLTSKLIREATDRNRERDERLGLLSTLTPRERQIVVLLTQGLVNKEIAVRMSISEKTVRNSLTVIYSKLRVANRLELAVFANREKPAVEL
jgi:DNA-binding NarL/FixJ family response regulator